MTQTGLSPAAAGDKGSASSLLMQEHKDESPNPLMEKKRLSLPAIDAHHRLYQHSPNESQGPPSQTLIIDDNV